MIFCVTFFFFSTGIDVHIILGADSRINLIAHLNPLKLSAIFTSLLISWVHRIPTIMLKIQEAGGVCQQKSNYKLIKLLVIAMV